MPMAEQGADHTIRDLVNALDRHAESVARATTNLNEVQKQLDALHLAIRLRPTWQRVAAGLFALAAVMGLYGWAIHAAVMNTIDERAAARNESTRATVCPLLNETIPSLRDHVGLPPDRHILEVARQWRCDGSENPDDINLGGHGG